MKKNGTEKEITIAAEKGDVVAHQAVVPPVAAQAAVLIGEKRNEGLEVTVLKKRNDVQVEKENVGPEVRVCPSQGQGAEKERAKNQKQGKNLMSFISINQSVNQSIILFC